MIAQEEIKRFGIREIIFVVIVSGVISALQYAGFLLFNPSVSFILSIFWIAGGMNLVLFVLRRSGAAGIFLILTAVITFYLNDLGVVGFPKVIVLLLVGLVFELLYLFLKGHIHNIPLDLVLGTSISMASIPLSVAYTLAPNLASSFPIALLNLMVIAFVTGLAGSLIIFIAWGLFERTKVGIKMIFYFY